MRTKRPLYIINLLLLLIAVTITVLWATSSDSVSEPQSSVTTTPTRLARETEPIKTKPLNFYQEVVAKRNIFRATPQTVSLIPQRAVLRLSGIIFDATHLTAAFIFNSATNTEGTYQEGSRINEWLITKIERKRVLLVNDAHQELILTIAPDALVGGSRNPSGTSSPPQPEKFASYSISKRRLNSTPIEKIREDIKVMLKKLPDEFKYQKIYEITGITQTDISSEVNLDDYATTLVMIHEGSDIAGDGESIIFATQLNPDNTPTSPATSFPPGQTRRIYACFSNQGALQGLSSVMVRWTNTTDGKIAYLGTKPINPSASNNYIWVEKKQGWSNGMYRVELFKVGTAKKAAQGRFEVKE